MTFLAVENLVVRYGRVPVLHGVDLAVERGTFVALLGASGSGKTTLLRAIAGFNPVASGRVRLDGRDITAEPPERRRMAMVFQSYALWPHMTVAQNLGYGLRLRRIKRAAIAEKIGALLQMLHLEGLGDRRVTQLSGGQRQRVALGRALAIDPDVLLLDEPLSNLDAAIRLELRHEIRAVQRRIGITAVHVTHDREEAMVIADRIVVLRDGRIAQQGTPQDVYHRPSTAFVASFMGADNVIAVTGSADGGAIRLVAADTASLLPPSLLPASLLPLGPGGVHLASPSPEGRLAAHFRAAAARLLPQSAPAPECALTLPGRIDAASYPGDVWRYTVEAAGQRFMIDDPQGFAPGALVQVAVPATALHLFAQDLRGNIVS